MHDIDIGMESDVVSFEEDTRVYSDVSDTSDCDILQRDLDKVYLLTVSSGCSTDCSLIRTLR